MIRRRRLLILIVTLIFTGAALAASLSKEKLYEASASLLFRDVRQDDVLKGGGAVPELAPPVRAAIAAESATSPEVTRLAHRELQESGELAITRDALEGLISAEVGVQTSLVSLSGSANNADAAAAIANAYAEAAREVESRKQLDRLDALEESTRSELEQASKDETLPGRRGLLEVQLSEIQTLQAVADPVQIATRAEPPAGPVAPKPVRDATVGLMLGLVFGLIAAFTRDSLDRRLHNPREVHDEIGLPVLGRVSEDAFGSPGLVSNGYPMLETDFEAFRVLRTNLGFLGQGGPPATVLVTSGLPEEGKSTVSLSLASAAALAGQRVLLVECDLRRPSFARRLGIPKEPGLTDYLMGNAAPADVLQQVPLMPPISGNGIGPQGQPTATLVCIAAGTAVATSAELLSTPRFREFLSKVSRAYDLVILDSSPVLAVVDPLEILPHVDGVLICVRVRQTTREEAHAARAALSHLPDKPMGAVVTGIKRGDPDAYDYYYGD